MGYDIFIQTTDGRRATEECVNYFHVPYFDMPRHLDAMNNFGMLVDLAFPTPPGPSAYGLSPEHFQPGYRADLAVASRVAEFRSAYQSFLDAAEPQPTGIPRYKLTHHEGFLTTAAEITAALTAYEAHPHAAVAEIPIGDQTWPRWIAFLRRAKEHGGLRTH
ncbi:hypothetical protein ACFVIM_00460 [Streptomyces sp. NPDC057638]|uniref:hypothetical protein n=1 Tax=Streptomyces sp. NPDC057638 TaxID=3346190 RepID=UPI0036B8D457